jgi:hypothetical protein
LCVGKDGVQNSFFSPHSKKERMNNNNKKSRARRFCKELKFISARADGNRNGRRTVGHRTVAASAAQW